MSLRRKLSNLSALIFAATLGFVLLGTYLLFKHYTNDLYYKKLLGRAHIAAIFFLEKDELSSQKYRVIEEKYLQITNEAVRIYHAGSGQFFVNDTLSYHVSAATLNEIKQSGSAFFRVGNRQLAGIFYRDNQGDFIIIASGINRVGDEQVTTLKWLLLAFFLVGVAINYLMTQWLAWYTFKPFSRVIKKVNSITADNLHTRLALPPGRPDELKQLIATFNYFLERLEAGVQSQRNFLKNASHELKTPLAVIIGDIEAALRNTTKETEHSRQLESLKKDALHLKSVVEGLLVLSGLEISQRQQMQLVRVDEILWNVLEKTRIEYPRDSISVNFDNMEKQERLLTIMGNRDLLFVAISNIVDNALKFSGHQPVSVVVEETGGRLVIIITDKGPGIPEKEKELVFDLFFRSAKTRHIRGHGIGLHLTRQILELHNIVLQISSPAEGGAKVQLSFPCPKQPPQLPAITGKH
jgi:signal transduction histidine kinase